MDTKLILEWTSKGATLVVALCILGALIQTIRSRSRMDIILCLDMVSYFAIALIALLVVSTGQVAFLDAAITLALIAFVATIALARYVELEARK